jgi:predicted RecB family nuclease
MGTTKNTTPAAEAVAGVNTGQALSAEEIAAQEAAAQEAAATEAAAKESAAVVVEAELIPAGKFIAENGDEYEIVVNEFAFKGKKYTKEEALSDHTDVLEHLISVNSFILKKV